MRLLVLLLLLVGAAARPARSAPAVFQCPDGSPPPCGARGAQRAAPRPIDPSRIAILPFRVTTADTMLGEGVAELLSQEFAGGRGPQAVHMGTVLRAWRQAGGGPRTPLAPEAAIRAARTMGAGMVVEGSIVGLGQRLTVNAAVISVPGGRTRRATPVSGSADSIDAIMRRLTTNLLAVAGGEGRSTERSIMTENPAAMRAYIEGLSAWRRYDVGTASRSFETAFRLDSTFARAAFMRMVTARWGSGNAPPWERATWRVRERLSPQDRILLTAYLGDSYPALRSPSQVHADRQRAAAQLPESPEAQYVFGDWLYHFGAADNVTDRIEQSVRLFRRSIELDTQETVLGHLADAAAVAGDTATLRAIQPALEQSPALWGTSWLAAALLGDEAWLARLRRRPSASTGTGPALLPTLGVLTPLVDEAIDLIWRADTVRLREQAMQIRFWSGVVQGRQSVTRSMAQAARPDDGAHLVIVLSSLYADGDSAAGHASAQRLIPLASQGAGPACMLGLWRLERGESAVPLDSVRRRQLPMCAAILDMEIARRAGAPDTDQRIAAADSVIRWTMGNATYLGFENVPLSRAWESRGDMRKALIAIRLRPTASSVVWTEAVAARTEGRLAAMTGDTAAAIRAYRRYVGMRRDAEGPLAAQRDSVRAALALLVDGRR